MFGHNPAPLPPHALSCLPWMLSARRNPLAPAGQLPLWLAAVGTEGVRTSRAKADRRRRERRAIAVREEEEGAVRLWQMSGFWRRSMHLFSASLALHSRGGEFIEPRVAPRSTDGRGGRVCRGRRQGGRCNAGNGNGEEDPREKRRDEARKDEERRSEKTEKRRGDDSKMLQGRQVLLIRSQMMYISRFCNSGMRECAMICLTWSFLYLFPEPSMPRKGAR